MTVRQQLECMIAFPVRFSLFVSLYGLLIFLPLLRPPIVLTLIMVSALVHLSLFFGQLLAKTDSSKRGDSDQN